MCCSTLPHNRRERNFSSLFDVFHFHCHFCVLNPVGKVNKMFWVPGSILVSCIVVAAVLSRFKCCYYDKSCAWPGLLLTQILYSA